MWKPPFFKEIFRKWSMRRFYQSFITNGNLCFDVGANKGERTMYYLELGAKVVALEPQKSCFNQIQLKFGNHQNLEILNSAVGSQEGFASLNLCSESDECASFSSKFIETYSTISGFHWPNTELVSVVTLDALIQKYRVPDFCKIDVEGYEREVFKGLNHTIPEIHFEFNQPLLKDTIECLKLLEKLGNYECNYLIYEKMKPILKTRVPIRVFRKNINSIIPSEIETGEILVSLTG